MAGKSIGSTSLSCSIAFSIPRTNADVIRAAARERGMSPSSLIRAALSSTLVLSEKTVDSVSRACAVCGSLLPVGSTRYCSDECRREAHRRAAAESFRRNQAANKQPRRCVICGTLLPDGSKALFCSDACKRQAREARRKRLSQSQPPED